MSKYTGMIEQERFTCAIGALETVTAIPRAVPILHSGPGCGEMIKGFYKRHNGYAGGNTSPCTNFSEKEVVFGGVNRLRQIIENTYKVLDTDLQVVMTGCTAGIVGDDVDSVVQEFADYGKPIVSVETAGFKATNYESHSLVVNAIIDQYVSRFEQDNSARSEKNTINLLSVIPVQDPFWEGNLKELKRLLEGIGLKVHVLFGSESEGVIEWQQIPRANFNVLVSPWYGKPIADNLKKRYGQNYTWYHHLPIGANQTEEFLEQVLDFALESGAELDKKRAKDFIKHESDAYYAQIDDLASFLLEFRYGLPDHVHIIHDASYVLAMSKFLLHETGIVPKEQFVVDGTPDKFQKEIQENLSATSDKREIPILFTPDAGLAQQKLREINHNGRGLIIGASWDRQLAKEKHCDYLEAANPPQYRLILSAHYAGFTGGLRLIEDIFNQVLSTYA